MSLWSDILTRRKSKCDIRFFLFYLREENFNIGNVIIIETARFTNGNALDLLLQRLFDKNGILVYIYIF